jgi:hypothetical protein
MTIKLIQTPVSKTDSSGSLGINPNIRITQGYSSNTISVKVEKILRPELTRDEEVEFSYETLIERTFTPEDFPMITDHNAFYLEYNVLNNSFEILDVLSFGEINRFNKVSYHNTSLNDDIRNRYNENLLPILYVKTFDAVATGFDCSLVQFYTQNPQESAQTVILNSDVEEMSDNDRQLWVNENLVSYLSFTIKNEDGSQIIDAQQTGAFVLNSLGQSNDKTNKYTVNLPAAKYTIEVNVVKTLYPENPNRYDIRIVNGYVNKTQVYTGAGSFIVKLDTSELDVGDFSKLKFDLGKFKTYAELWVTII